MCPGLLDYPDQLSRSNRPEVRWKPHRFWGVCFEPCFGGLRTTKSWYERSDSMPEKCILLPSPFEFRRPPHRRALYLIRPSLKGWAGEKAILTIQTSSEAYQCISVEYRK